ncbi:hypothetical protein CPLU01_07253 [Colletotrichum plurivorum]|uniref:Uncharacterized protein n=1 Tax=Colletotrichum plurivorum TaxID=2175906 RepID=A0A8H6KG04_9PEZI|nr:hypothetical protein CPLU01_07253 [Colletotrichum plurivorum]
MRRASIKLAAATTSQEGRNISETPAPESLDPVGDSADEHEGRSCLSMERSGGRRSSRSLFWGEPVGAELDERVGWSDCIAAFSGTLPVLLMGELMVSPSLRVTSGTSLLQRRSVATTRLQGGYITQIWPSTISEETAAAPFGERPSWPTILAGLGIAPPQSSP